MLIDNKWVITSARRVNETLVELSVTDRLLRRRKLYVQRRQTDIESLRAVLAAHDQVTTRRSRLAR